MRLAERRKTVFFKIWLVLLIISTMIFPSVTHAARPFVTDDAGTTGRAGFQIEAGIESSSTKNHEEGVAVRETETELSTVLTYGITDSLDIMAGLPYTWKKRKEGGQTVFNKDRLSDMTLEAKWRFYEKDGLGIAIKPGVGIPSGDYRQGFGTGRTTYGAMVIISKEVAPVGLHLNAGYTRNENRTDERKDLLSASFAITVETIKDLTIGGDIGLTSNNDPRIKTAPAFFLVGAHYKIGKYTTVDSGVKVGLNRYEADHAFIGGLTIKF